MDGLAEQLATSFSVSSDPNSTAAPHPRFTEYKKKGTSSDQEGRRKSILELQKNKRFDYANLARCIVEDTWEDAEAEDFDDGEEEAMDATDTPAKKRYKPGRYYRNQLMLSEWLIEEPANFEEDWLMVVCPWGKRCLIVSAKGTTTAYGRNGYRVNSFPSHLPGGNRRQKNHNRENAILDCIFHEVEKTFYVLDIMNWKDHPVYDSETDFRFFWMISKLQEFPELGEPTKLNPYKFVPLQYHACKKDNLKQVFETTEQQFDGCLFYHKRAHYTFGASPLVVWLKPYMVNEMLSIEVPERMNEQKPANYSTYAAHLEHVKETKEKIAADKEKRVANKKARRGADRSREFKMELMESKWFTEIPEDFETDWCTVVCPVGQRCLVMALDGETKWFNKKGFKLPGYFLSVLPGGNGHDYGYGPTEPTLLDCIYSEEMATYFIIDCIKWFGQDLTDMTFKERAKLMKKEMLRNPEFKAVTDLNMFRMVPLYHYDCNLEGLDLALRQSTFEIDGLLFYKNDVRYTSGVSKDILWTKPYILPDVFEGIAVPKYLMELKPDTYTDFESFVDDVDHGRIKEKKKKKKKKEFVPQVELNLPEQRNRDGSAGKGRRKKEKKVQQSSYYGPGVGFRGRGMGRGRGRGRGGHREGAPDGRGDNYGRLLASAGGDNRGRQIYGKGKASGFSYYGDERDMYYAQGGYQPEMGSRRNRGNQDPYMMGEMEAALGFYEYDNGRRMRPRNQYKLF